VSRPDLAGALINFVCMGILLYMLREKLGITVTLLNGCLFFSCSCHDPATWCIALPIAAHRGRSTWNVLCQLVHSLEDLLHHTSRLYPSKLTHRSNLPLLCTSPFFRVLFAIIRV